MSHTEKVEWCWLNNDLDSVLRISRWGLVDDSLATRKEVHRTKLRKELYTGQCSSIDLALVVPDKVPFSTPGQPYQPPNVMKDALLRCRKRCLTIDDQRQVNRRTSPLGRLQHARQELEQQLICIDSYQRECTRRQNRRGLCRHNRLLSSN